VRPEDIPLIRQLPLFATMSAENFDRLLQASYLQWFPAGVTLIREGDPADFFHVVVDGAVELFAKHGERETAISLRHPVSTFILAAVVKDALYLMSARTIDPSRLLMIPSKHIRLVIAEDPAFAQSMIDELAIGFRGMVRTLKNYKLRTGAERLANYLLRLYQENGHNETVTLPHEKRLIASLLGMTPENLSRALATLADYGVEVLGRRIVLRRVADLEAFAKPSPLIDELIA